MLLNQRLPTKLSGSRHTAKLIPHDRTHAPSVKMDRHTVSSVNKPRSRFWRWAAPKPVGACSIRNRIEDIALAMSKRASPVLPQRNQVSALGPHTPQRAFQALHDEGFRSAVRPGSGLVDDLFGQPWRNSVRIVLCSRSSFKQSFGLSTAAGLSTPIVSLIALGIFCRE